MRVPAREHERPGASAQQTTRALNPLASSAVRWPRCHQSVSDVGAEVFTICIEFSAGSTQPVGIANECSVLAVRISSPSYRSWLDAVA